MNLDDKIAIVTGAATGIGAAIARGFAESGATTYGLDNAWGDDDAGGGAIRIDCDLTDERHVQEAVRLIEADHGAVDVLVNNAALSGDVEPKPFEEITSEEWMRILRNNTLAPLNCTKAVVPGMRSRSDGRIVNLSSGTAFTGVPNTLAYVASKGAVVTMTRALAKELGDDGITVNGVAPGLTATAKMKANPGWPDSVWERSIQNRSIKREESVDDLVGACLFFASDGARFVSGQTLIVDGGFLLN